MELIVLAAMTHSRVIGLNNSMPWHSSLDLRRFRALTSGHPVLMGKNTYASIGKPLPKRSNIVLSRSMVDTPGVLLARNWQQALQLASECAGNDKLFIIGGEQVYQQALPQAHKLELTIIEREYSGDTHFPEIDSSEWLLSSQQNHPEVDPPLAFLSYTRRPPTPKLT